MLKVKGAILGASSRQLIQMRDAGNRSIRPVKATKKGLDPALASGAYRLPMSLEGGILRMEFFHISHYKIGDRAVRVAILGMVLAVFLSRRLAPLAELQIRACESGST